MRIAAEAGLAPRIHYLDANDRVVMMDFIEDRGLDNFPGGPAGLAQATGALLRQLQSGALFSPFMDYTDLVRRVWAHVCRTGLFAGGVLDAASERLADLCRIYVL